MIPDEDDQETGSSLSYGLRGRQSVRATFRLSAGCIETISIVASQLGIKQKSLFDHLVEDAVILSDMARKSMPSPFDERSERVQKTFVLSRRSLVSLESVANAYNTPRDMLVEMSVRRLLPIIVRERGKHMQRKALMQELMEHRRAAYHLAGRIEGVLGAEDPVSREFAGAVTALDHALAQISDLIERGRVLEDFEVSDESGQDE